MLNVSVSNARCILYTRHLLTSYLRLFYSSNCSGNYVVMVLMLPRCAQSTLLVNPLLVYVCGVDFMTLPMLLQYSALQQL
jgi:hypothetical protein